MKLVDDIIELAVDDAVRLPIILRKCLVVATRLNNERLKGWVKGELNGYEDLDDLPQYRVLRIQAKGLFLGPNQRELRDQVLPPAILDKDHRVWATTANLREGIAAYELLAAKDGAGTVRLEWPGDLVLYYQEKFFKGWALNRAWQEIPRPALAALVDSVRNGLLEFALKLQEEIGDPDVPPGRNAAERIDNAVITIIYGGQNVIANNIVGDVKQNAEFYVVQGDFVSLRRVLDDVGVAADEIGALEKAIAQDKEAGEEKGLGVHTTEWLRKALTYVGKGGGKIAGGVMKTTLSKAVMAYLGLE